MQPGLAHKGKKSHGFQGDCLSARVWSCDHQQVKITAQMDINRNYLFLVQQGMSALADVDKVVFVEQWLRGVHLHGKFCLGKNKIKKRHDFLVVRKLLCVDSGLGTQIGKNLSDFFFFLQLQFPQLIVQVYHGGRFDKICGTGGRLVMNHTVYLPLIL